VRSRRRVVGLALGLALAALAAFELWLPARVAWEPAQLGGMPAQRADGLVLQDARGGELWATRGYGIYRSTNGGAFERVTTLAPRLGPAWAGFSRTFRDALRYQELVELMALDDTTLLAFAGGDAYRVDLASGAAERVHRLRYFGPGRGRGLMPHGMTRDARGAIYYGEYPTGALAPRETVRIWRSRDAGRTWEVAHEFAPGAVRHVHALQWDPVGDALWVATGDRDAECHIGYSRDGGATFTWIGAGSQTFRAVSFLFTPEAVSWAMDSPPVAKHLVRWDRASGAVSASRSELPHPGYYAASLAGERGIVTLGETDASLWAVANGEPVLLHEWEVSPNPSRPHPVVRLLRSEPEPRPDAVYVNPLRTLGEAAAIYRVEAARLLTSAP
jgi:hypothetical protein